MELSPRTSERNWIASGDWMQEFDLPSKKRKLQKGSTLKVGPFLYGIKMNFVVVLE